MKRYVICLLALLWLTTARAEVRLPRLISDGMVLQREAKVNIWGWANVGEQITVSFVGKIIAPPLTHKADGASVSPRWQRAVPFAWKFRPRIILLSTTS